MGHLVPHCLASRGGFVYILRPMVTPSDAEESATPIVAPLLPAHGFWAAAGPRFKSSSVFTGSSAHRRGGKRVRTGGHRRQTASWHRDHGACKRLRLLRQGTELWESALELVDRAAAEVLIVETSGLVEPQAL